MRRSLLRVSPEALLALALFVYVSETRFLLALLPAVLLHELGHLLALWLLGVRAAALRPELTGLRIDYAASGNPAEELLAAAAGPAAGLCYAWLASRLGARLSDKVLLLSAGLSLALSLFNLLPAPPLDGGRIAASLLSLWPGGETGERLTRLFGALTALGLCAAGLRALLRGRGAAVLLAGAMLAAEQLKTLRGSRAAYGYGGCHPPGTPRRPAGSPPSRTASGRRPAPPRR